jgi:hypothetical protein
LTFGERAVGLVIGLGLGAMSIGLAWMTWQSTGSLVFQALDARSWPAATCAIVRHEVTEAPGRRTIIYGTDLAYTFTLGDEVHEGHRPDFSAITGSGSRSTWEALRDRYPAGSQVECFVDLDRPGEAVLDRRIANAVSVWPLIPLLISAVTALFSFVGFAQAFASDKQHRRGKPLTQRESKGCLLSIAGILGVGSASGAAFFGFAADSVLEVVLTAVFAVLLLGSLPLGAYAVAQVFVPRLLLVVNPDPVKPGVPFELAWSFSRRGGVAALSIRLKAEQWHEGGDNRAGIPSRTELASIDLVDEFGEGAVAGVVTATMPHRNLDWSSDAEVSWYLEAEIGKGTGPAVTLSFDLYSSDH